MVLLLLLLLLSPLNQLRCAIFLGYLLSFVIGFSLTVVYGVSFFGILRTFTLNLPYPPILPSDLDLRSRSRPASAFCNSRWTLFLPFFDFARLTPPLGLVCMRAALGCSARFVIYFITAYRFWKLYYSIALLLMDGTCYTPLSLFLGLPFYIWLGTWLANWGGTSRTLCVLSILTPFAWNFSSCYSYL